MPAILDFRVKGVRMGNLAISVGSTVGCLKEALIAAGYNLADSYTRLWRGLDQNDIYVGNCDNISLESYDSVAFCGPDYCVSVDNVGAHSYVDTEEPRAEEPKHCCSCHDETAAEKEQRKQAIDNAAAAGAVVREEFDKICTSFSKIKTELEKVIS